MKVILTEEQLISIIKEARDSNLGGTYRIGGPRPGQSSTGSRDGGRNGGVGGMYTDTDYTLSKDGAENHFPVTNQTPVSDARGKGRKSNYGVNRDEPGRLNKKYLDSVFGLSGGDGEESENSYEYTTSSGNNNGAQSASIDYGKSINIGSANTIRAKLMSLLDWKQFQAGALCAIIEKESGFNPRAFNKGEMKGTHRRSYASSRTQLYADEQLINALQRNGGFDVAVKNNSLTQEQIDSIAIVPNSSCNYGAGLIQWSNKRKINIVLPFITEICPNAAAKFGRVRAAEYWLKLGALTGGNFGGIENVGLDMQIKFIVYELTQGSYNKLGATVRGTTTPEEALATLYCYYVAGSKNSSTPASPEQAEAISRKYASINGKAESGFQGRMSAMNQRYLA